MAALPHFSTPMMRQYATVKKQYKDCLLFFRMGDFYELFLEDAHIGSSVLNITLTKKNGGKDGKIPMAGVPYHAVDTYISKLVKAGYKVAICEQLTPPNKKGIVERDVVRIVTPGTLLDENSLEKKENNYIVSISAQDSRLSLSVADLSTGFFATEEKDCADIQKTLVDELTRIQPSECILPDSLYNDADFLKVLTGIKGLNIFPFSEWTSSTKKAKQFLLDHFQIKTLEVFGLDETLTFESAAALLAYLKQTQKGHVSHVKRIVPWREQDGLILDRSTMINLELFSTIREHDTRGSLLSVVDETITAMGGRLLKHWMKKPLIVKDLIEARLEGVDYFCEQTSSRNTMREILRQLPDIERLVSRLSVNLGNARDLINLKHALDTMIFVKQELERSTSTLLKTQAKKISPDLSSLAEYITLHIVEEPPLSVKEGGMIREGVRSELDQLRERIGKSKTWITQLEKKERERTGINSLKVRFNKVFGFYIEISHANAHLIPQDYMRKQTLVNGERFITIELKEHEEIILSAEEKIHELEYEIFTNVILRVLQYTEQIQNASESIAVVDCIATFSYISEKRRYVRPKLLYSGEIRIKEGRHPVVETLLGDDLFVPNDVSLDNTSQTMLLVTGPNMAGKSVFIRQTALIVLMAQMGCFVPASTAHISIVDRIFVRSGASDVITSGLSTFMVEMVETAYILNNATKNSLIVMDEIGRGTSTYDGISIAWSVAEYLVKNILPSPKTLFATHYHELQALEEEYPRQIKNFHMAVTEEKGEPIFLHTILPGGASHSYGVSVAKLAGMPESVIKRAKELLLTLETRNVKEEEVRTIQYNPNTTILDHLLQKEFEDVDVANMTPLEALNKLAEIKEKLKLLSSENRSYGEID